MDNKIQTKFRMRKLRKLYPWKRVYDSIQQRCENSNNISYKYYGAKGIRCKITPEEIKRLWFRDKAYLLEKPSIDRIKSDKNYTFSNCRFIERGLNSTERNIRVSSKPVSQFFLNGVFIETYQSVSEAGRQTGITRSGISLCCLNKRKTSGGFIWRYIL